MKKYPEIIRDNTKLYHIFIGLTPTNVNKLPTEIKCKNCKEMLDLMTLGEVI